MTLESSFPVLQPCGLSRHFNQFLNAPFLFGVVFSLIFLLSMLFLEPARSILFRSTRINVPYQQILLSLQLIVFIRLFESVLIEVFFTGNIYPTACIDDM